MRVLILALIFLFVAEVTLSAQPLSTPADSPNLQISIQTGQENAGNLSINLQLLILFTVLSVVPSLLIMTTSFVRIVIVLSFLRSGLAVQQPSNQVILSLALFLTFFIMAPTFNQLNQNVLTPMKEKEITTEEGLERATNTMKIFMLKYVRDKDLALFMKMSNEEIVVDSPEELPASIIIPAFMISELKTGFQMGMMLVLPFLVIDMVVASILMSMGMMMLPPPVVSLPLKLMVFVLVDGWSLIVTSIVNSFQI